MHAVREDAARLVRLAADGDTAAWERLVDQYERLISAITWEFRLADGDAADVAQTTWMRLIEHIHRIEHPEHIASWLATTARNECRHQLASRKRLVLSDGDLAFEERATSEVEIDDALLAAERAEHVQRAMASLPARWRRLMEMLMADPPVPYADISIELGLPIGSIGPTRGRCLARLRTLLQTSLTATCGRPYAGASGSPSAGPRDSLWRPGNGLSGWLLGSQRSRGEVQVLDAGA